MGRGSGGWVLGAALGLGAACFNPTGTADLTLGTSEASATSVGATTSEPTTGGATTTTTGGCEACRPPTPYCLPNGQCGGCEALPDHGLSCAALTPTTPVCDPDAGVCVECVADADCGDGACDPDSRTCVECVTDEHCPGATVCDAATHTCMGCFEATDCTDPKLPVCDVETGTCRKCREHRDCPATACELDEGICFPNDATQTQPLYVDAGAKNCAAASCEVGMPCCELATALEKAAAQPKPYVVIRVAGGAGSLPATLTTSGKKVAVLADKNFVLTPAMGTGAILLGGANMAFTASKLFLSGLRIVGGANSTAVGCINAAGVWLDEVEVRGNAGYSLYSYACPVQVRRSQFVANQYGVAGAAESEVVLENTIVAGIKASPVVVFMNDTVMSMRYVTLGEPDVVYERMVECDGTGTLNIRNSVLVSSGTISLNPCMPTMKTVVHTASTASHLAGAGDNKVVTLQEVVPLFESWAARDLRLVEAGPLADVARWEAALDPLVDFEGAPRPARDGSPDVAGADLPGPPPAGP